MTHADLLAAIQLRFSSGPRTRLLRANWIRIGELSADLDTSKGGRNTKETLPSAGKSKNQALRAARPLR
jgi:hypothetical protein